MTNYKEISEKLEVGKKYSLWAMGDFGFPYSFQFTLKSVKVEPYAQYKESMVIVYLEKGKRKSKGLRYYGNCKQFAIWQGHVKINSDMFTKFSNDVGIIKKESLEGFSNEYLVNALKSVSEKPLVVGGEEE